MSSNQTPKQRTLAARPGAKSEKVTKQDGTTFTRIIDGAGMVIGQSDTPLTAWRNAAHYVETQDAMKAHAITPEHDAGMTPNGSVSPEWAAKMEAEAAAEVRETAEVMVKPQSERHEESAALYAEPKVTHTAPPEDGPRARMVPAKVKQARRNKEKIRKNRAA